MCVQGAPNKTQFGTRTAKSPVRFNSNNQSSGRSIDSATASPEIRLGAFAILEEAVGLHDQERVRFKVVSWADCTKTGKIVDVQGIAYDVGIKSLSPDADGVLFPGEEVEGDLAGWNQFFDIA